MAKKQESYELMTVFSLKNGEEAAKELVEKFREKIASSATLDEVNEWGKRKLAYPINDEPDGYYTLYTFTSTPGCSGRSRACSEHHRRRSAFSGYRKVRPISERETIC